MVLPVTSAVVEPTQSPCRQVRDVERKDLEELNGRLQQYIMKQRAKDASREVWEREIKAVQAQAAATINANTKKYDEHLRQMRLQRDEHASAREELQVRVSRQEAAITRLKDQFSEEKREQNELLARANKIASELEMATAANVVLQEKTRKLEHALKIAEGAGQAAEEQLAESREMADQFSHEASAMRAKCKSIEQDLVIFTQTSEAEQARLRTHIDELTKSNAESEDQIRQEFATQLSEIVEGYRKQCNEDKARITRELKSFFMPKLDESRLQLEASIHSEAELKDANVQLNDEVHALTATCERLSEMKAAQEKRIEELTNDLDRERNDNGKDKEIERLRKECQRLERDFDDLMDVKIELALTIEKYRDLLSEEEHRLGIETPGRKRKRSRRSSVGGPVMKLSVDEENGCLVVMNEGTGEPVDMAEWSLQSCGLEFNFTNSTKLSPKESVSIWIGEGPLQHEDDDEDVLVWQDADPNELAKDKMRLVDSAGNVVDQIILDTVAVNPNEGSCLIM